ncbi:hypothetical protein E4H12_11350 [Candidatus Thorarchaeota archaeon]|nr:MAG: hypothetical protein E4H12_11350 [Candidatus Thorarchaeota archaeon]
MQPKILPSQFTTFGESDDPVAKYLLVGQTTDGTPTEIFLDGIPDARLVLEDNSSYNFIVTVVARRTDSGSEVAGYTRSGVMKRDSGVGTTALVGPVVDVMTNENTAAWDVTITADTTNGSGKLVVTGVGGSTITWLAVVQLIGFVL